jgi:hypothetical protein
VPRRVASKKNPIFLYVGSLDQLTFDTDRWVWPDRQALHSYTAKKGRYLLNPQLQLEQGMVEKWAPASPASFTPKWMEIWNRRRPRKDAGFLWSIYHGAVTTNVWRAKISTTIDPSCTYCNISTTETLLHRFYHCPKTTHAWLYAMSLLYRYVGVHTDQAGCWPSLTWQ